MRSASRFSSDTKDSTTEARLYGILLTCTRLFLQSHQKEIGIGLPISAWKTLGRKHFLLHSDFGPCRRHGYLKRTITMSTIDILLAYPNPTEDSPVKLTPLSILYPGAMFEAEGKRVAYWDERWDPIEEFDALVAASAELGVSAFTGTQAGRASALISRAKLLNPALVVGVGGHH